MKRIITICAAFLMTASLWAQSPEKMSYQAVVRDGSNNLISSTGVGVQISILQGSEFGTAVYVETQTPTSNTNGLVSLEIGEGTIVSGTFASIDWANGPYFIKTETDPTGGTNYTITGTSQLLSVPYALYAKTSGSSIPGPQGPAGLNGATGPMGPQGPAGVDGNGFSNGSANGEMLYWNGSAWVTVATTTSEGATLQMISGVPTWMGGTPPALDVTNPTTGKIWKDRNLGATQVATSSTNVPSYGDLYQWGRGTDGHQIRTSSTTATLSSTDTPGHGDFITGGDWRSPQNDNLWQGVAGINNPCPSGYRLPTEAELDAERASWGTNNPAGAFASPLKLPMAGYRDSNGSLTGVGTYGFYQSSTVSGIYSRSLYLNGSNAGMTTYTRSFGFSVRCIKD